MSTHRVEGRLRRTVPGDWPLIGRADEMRQLRKILLEEVGGGVVLSGAAGVGKSRIGAECLRIAEEVGLATAHAIATESAAHVPFGALAPLLPSVSPGEHHSPVDLLRRFSASLTSKAGVRPLVLLVDDAHLLDHSSATLIHQLVLTRSATVLLTLRAGEPVPDPIVGLWKDQLVERIEVGGMVTDEVASLLTVALRGPVDPVAARRIAEAAEGNALFLRELVLGALDDSSLRQVRGEWRLVGPLAPSSRLIELVESRLNSLQPAERQALEVVALGEAVGPAELDAFGLLSVCAALEEKSLLVTRTNGRRLEIRVAHPVYGEVIRNRMPNLRRRVIASGLAECVERFGARRREDLLRIAVLRLEVGGANPEMMTAAAHMARWRYDFPLAERLARAAIDAHGGFEAALLAAQLSGLQGDRLREATELEQLVSQARTDEEKAQVALARLDTLIYYLGEFEEGRAIAEDAEDSIADPDWRNEIAARRAGVLLLEQGPAAAAEAACALLERARGPGLVWACMVACHSLGRLGKLDAAIAASDKGYATQQSLAKPMVWYPAVQRFFRCDALTCAGHLLEAEELARREYANSIEEHVLENQAYFAWSLTRICTERGLIASAVHFGREALSLCENLGYYQFARECAPHLAQALALSGKPLEARKVLERVEAPGQTPPLFSTAVDRIQAHAWTALANGDLRLGKQLFTESADQAAAMKDTIGEITALHGLARLGYPAEVVSRLADLAGQVEGPMGPARAAHADGLHRKDVRLLAEVSEQFGALGANLLAAEAAADAAVACERFESKRRATAYYRRADKLLGECEGGSTPALQAVKTRAQLTRTEREIAILAAAGRSNNQIARELVISFRTVENHLHHVYEKLGISGRRELSTAVLDEDWSPLS
jgi:DNA-binding CsgD family transcriptional regulator